MRRNALFRIDPDEIEDRLRAVNAPLLAQAEALLDEARGTWRTGAAPRMRRDLGRLRRLAEDIRRIRLSDTAPLREAAAAGKRVFAETESRLEVARDALHVRISDLEFPGTAIPARVDAPLAAPARALEGTSPIPDGPDRATTVIEGFDRTALPMEALRPYLTDHAIRTALNRHLAEHGPTLGPAVRYRTRAPA